MAIVKRALLLSTGERYLTIITNFVMLAIVSRILTPAEIGVSVIGMSIIGVALALREFASSTFLIQQPDLSREDIRAAFSVILILTLIITATLGMIAPLLATIFKVSGLATYIRVISVCILIDTFATHVISLLRREMAFGRVALINTTSIMSGAVLTIILALAGFSYLSFALGWLLSAIVSSTLAIWFRPYLWMFTPSLKRAPAMIKFGGYNGATFLLTTMIDQLPYFLLGRVASLEAAAMYNRGLMLSQIPEKIFIGGAVPVLLPAFAAEAREGRSVKKAYLHAVEIVTALQWPALLVLAILAYTVVNVMLGQQWEASIPLVRILAIAALFSFSFALNDPALMAIGAVRDVFLRAAIVFPVAAAVITAAAIYGGMEATAWAMMIVIPFRAYVSMRFACRRMEIRWMEIFIAMRRSAATAVATAVGPLAVAISADTPFQLGLDKALLASLLAAIGWLAGLWITRHPLRRELASALTVAGAMLSRPGLRAHSARQAISGQDPS